MKILIISAFCLLPAAYCLAQSGNTDTVSIKKNKKESSSAPLPECCSSPESRNDTTQSERKKFLFTGSAFTNIIMGSKFDSAGFEAGFMPVFLYQPDKRLYFVLHMHLSAGGGHLHSNQSATASTGTSSGGHNHGGASASTSTSTSAATATSNGAGIMLYYANMVYYFNPYLTITGGMIPASFGIYPERLHLPWQNKLPDAPLGMGHADAAIPLVDFGFQASGEIPIRKFKIHYALSVSNGPSLIESGSDAGKLSYSNLIDNNKNKAAGGRIGLLPVPNSTLEIGLFGQRAKVGQDATSYSGVDALLYGVDISFHDYIKPIKGTIDIKGQYNVITADKVYYKADPILTLSVPAEDVNLSDSTYRFKNESQTYFFTVSYRPDASRKFIKNTEYILRYDVLNTPCFALWDVTKTRWTAGAVYWMDIRSAIKFSFQTNLSPKPIGQNRIFNNLFIMQWVIGV
ncbi:MAG: hypothetical protein EPN85_14730 [Bacteroidetes bacterium]|nr:MAG: hypothetical protein EPN85_14730 [Bacteroidota bacterium]